jgi:rhodanese-related sulfurtransferase
VRQSGQYQAGHIAGAISLPEAEIPTRGSSLPKGKKLITYCS